MMKKSMLLPAVLAAVLLSSCAGSRGITNNAPECIPVIKKDVKVLGTVRVEMKSNGILGFTPELSLVSWGDKSSYTALLDEAKKIGADDVVNLKTDNYATTVLFFYNDRKWVTTGLAVKYLEGVPSQDK